MNAVLETPLIARPQWLEPASARALLAEKIDAVVGLAAGAQPSWWDDDAPANTFRVTAGLGKTSETLRAIAKHADDLLARGHVLIYVPTLDLAKRAADEFREIRSDVPFAVIRGRQAKRPDSDIYMCKRADLAQQLSGLVPSVGNALCRTHDGEKTVEADCADGCPYLAQRNQPGAKVYFLAHSYLQSHPPIDAETPVALRVVDEKVWPVLTTTTELFAEDLFAPMRGTPNQRLLNRQLSAGMVILQALRQPGPIAEYLKAREIDSKDLIELAKAEARHREVPKVLPTDKAEAIAKTLEGVDRRSFMGSRRREMLYKLLADDESEPDNKLYLTEKWLDGKRRQVLQIGRLKALPRDAPLLLLDADADEEISQRIAPGTEFTRIDAQPDAEVVQVSDRMMSNSYLLDKSKGALRRARIIDILKREVARAEMSKVLVVASKPVLKQLHDDCGHFIDCDEDLQHPLCGATARWFGPRMQGVNDFKDYPVVVVIGRLQPRVADIEASACSLFGEDRLPLSRHQSGQLPVIGASRLISNGELEPMAIRGHPDRRVHAVLRQQRECATAQAIARLRLVAPDRPKRVVIICNLPVPDLPVTRLMSFEGLYRDLADEPDPAGILRLETALTSLKDLPVLGTRLSTAGLTQDLPRGFEGEAAAAHFRRGRPSHHIVDLVKRIAQRNGWPTTFLALSRPGRGGKPTPAVVFCDRTAAIAQSDHLWPDLSAKILKEVD